MTSFSFVTAQDIIDQAQMRHPAFSNALAPIGVLLKALDARQRTLILANIEAIDGLVNTTVQIGFGISGVLVGVENGVPLVGIPGTLGWFEHREDDIPFVDFSEAPALVPFGTGITYPDGWAVHFDEDGVPYANFGEAPIAFDPFGAHGGTPGFPLPVDFIKLNGAVAITAGDETLLEVTIVAETDRLAPTRSGLTAFISGKRIIPLRARAGHNSGDAWSQPLKHIQLSYVALPTLTDPSQYMTLPAVLHEAAIAWLAEFLAASTPGVSANEKSIFAMAARMAEEGLQNVGFKIANVPSPRSVRYRR